MPGYENIQLKEDGQKIDVTIYNLGEYISLMVHSFQTTSTIQINAFRNGFNPVFNINSLKIFKAKEIEELVCGGGIAGSWDLAMLGENIIPDHGYTLNRYTYIYIYI